MTEVLLEGNHTQTQTGEWHDRNEDMQTGRREGITDPSDGREQVSVATARFETSGLWN